MRPELIAVTLHEPVIALRQPSGRVCAHGNFEIHAAKMRLKGHLGQYPPVYYKPFWENSK